MTILPNKNESGANPETKRLIMDKDLSCLAPSGKSFVQTLGELPGQPIDDKAAAPPVHHAVRRWLPTVTSPGQGDYLQTPTDNEFTGHFVQQAIVPSKT